MVDSVGVDVPSCCVVAGVYAQACTLQDGTRVDAVRRSFIMCHSAEAVRDCECMCGWVCVNVLKVSGVRATCDGALSGLGPPCVRLCRADRCIFCTSFALV